jgi:DNA polymerase-4
VGGGSRGVVASASYEARKYGIRAAMPLYKARKLCPRGIFIRGNHEQYMEFSKEMFRIFREFTPAVEITSIDEGYLDLKGTEQMHKADCITIAERILKTVHQRLQITISGGLSTSKVVSKIAASQFKPRCLTCIFPGGEATFLKPLPIQSMP